MTAKPASSMSADELWGTLLGAPVTVLPGVYDIGADEPSGLKKVAHRYCAVHGSIEADFAFAHVSCVNLCPYCASPVTNEQISDGDAFPIDERGPDDGKYAHRECAQGAREP